MKRNSTKKLVEDSVMLATAAILSLCSLQLWTAGGKVTLFSMLPLCIISIKNGLKHGITTAFAYSLFELYLGICNGLIGWCVTPLMLILSIFFDYILAFTVIGLAGLFREKGYFYELLGIILVMFLRFTVHFFSGIFIWKSVGELFKGFSTDSVIIFSLLYNGSFMLPELIITVIAAAVLLRIRIFRDGPFLP